jgi:hypothetical protein
MKSERRHELQHNELAEWLIRAGQTLKPYQNLLFTVVAVVALVFAGHNIWSRIAASQAAEAWEQVIGDLDSDKLANLAKVIEEYPGTHAAHCSAVVLADYYLADGCNRLFVNKASGQEDLTKAIEYYQQVRQQSSESSLLERATFGLARAREAKGDATQLEQAVKLYAEVVEKWPDGAFAVAARQREEDLKRPATLRLYDRFAAFDPKPAFTKEPGGKDQGIPLPFDAKSMPEEGTAIPLDTTFKLKPEGAEKGKDKPKADEKKPPEKAKEPEKSKK